MLAGRARNAGLGPYPEISLARARELAGEWRAKLKGVNPVDPLDERRKNLDAMRVASSQTFGAAAELWLAKEWESWSPRYAAEVRKMVTKRCAPIWNRPVADIDTRAVQAVLDPFWREHRVTASRLRMHIESVLDFAAVAKHWRLPGDNPARWSGHLEHVYNAPSTRDVEHLAALPHTDAPALTAELRERGDMVARALEFAVLTAARTGEVLGARWNEIDFAARTWTVPADRMKGGREHRVPLSSRVIALLEALPRGGDGDRVFNVPTRGMWRLMQKMRPGVTVHGFRSAFKDYAQERAHAPIHVVEMCLAHAVEKAVEKAYGRSDLLARRATLMEQWSEFLSRPLVSGDVVQLRKAQ
jgi:integrase